MILVSNGGYRYNHETDRKLFSIFEKDKEFALFQTDRDGMITLLTDGNELGIKSYHKGEYIFE